MVKRILITGANKGIGFAAAKRILTDFNDTFVFLGCRDMSKGQTAVESLTNESPDLMGRVTPVVIDVTDDNSVGEAAKYIKDTVGTDLPPLYGIVNNAGIGIATKDGQTIFATNVYGPRRVNNAFIPLLEENGRVVLVSSAAGPMFVSKCSAEYQKFFLNPDVTWEDIENTMNLFTSLSPEECTSSGLGDGQPYFMSKACLNSYMNVVVREHPSLCINACTPGFIDTDMTSSIESSLKKPPYEGTHSIVFLLMSDIEGSGKYYGSDCIRSPLDKYRGPGDPPYTGE
eukprot:gene6380-12901_t